MGCNDPLPTLDYTVKENRVILNSNGNIKVVWFKDLKSFTLSGTSLYFKTKYGNVMVKEADLTGYNGWGVAPSISTIYADTSAAISTFDDISNVNVIGDSTVLNQNAPYRVVSDRDPLPTDDISFGHVPTVQWLNTTTSDLFECISNTSGAAVWQEIQYIHL